VRGRLDSRPRGVLALVIDATRPYEPLGMTTAKWADVPVVEVELGSLVWSQEVVTVAGLIAHARGALSVSGDRLPHVVEWNGQRFVSDGHHRLLVDFLRGAERAPARVLVVQ
jgi:hypothetical protein